MHKARSISCVLDSAKASGPLHLLGHLPGRLMLIFTSFTSSGSLLKYFTIHIFPCPSIRSNPCFLFLLTPPPEIQQLHVHLFIVSLLPWKCGHVFWSDLFTTMSRAHNSVPYVVDTRWIFAEWVNDLSVSTSWFLSGILRDSGLSLTCWVAVGMPLSSPLLEPDSSTISESLGDQVTKQPWESDADLPEHMCKRPGELFSSSSTHALDNWASEHKP